MEREMIGRLRALWLIAVLSLAAPALARAQPVPPKLTAPVNDFANAIDPASAQQLDQRIRALQAAAGDTVVVATVQTFQPYGDIQSYAVKMFENGGEGIGQAGKDNGVLIVVAVEDREVAIEVGYSLEEFITDGFAGQTIREEILPEFRSGAYGRGLLAGATRIINRLADARGVTLENVPRAAPAQPPSFQFPIRGLLILLFILFMMGRSGRRRPRGRHWGAGPWSGWNSGVGSFGGGFGGGFGGFGGGGGGGGFGGFGGGRSGGGGASGSW
jgi:uncharacterized protein